MGKLLRQNRALLALCILLLLSLLSACGKKEEEEPSVLVSIAEGEHYTVEANGQEVVRGDEVTFSLLLEDGYQFLESDYRGEVRVSQEDERTELTFVNVRYPQRIHPKVTNRFFNITYLSNDENQTELEDYEERIYHARPNTRGAMEAFEREGYTLTSWNTKADGSGERIGLGSRVTVEGAGITLYAMWEPWTDASYFSYEVYGDEVMVTKCTATDDCIVLPAEIEGKPVTMLGEEAFAYSPAKNIILHKNLRKIEEDAFYGSNMEKLVIYSNIDWVMDEAFTECRSLQTIYINAAEPPGGAADKKECVYADKIDLMILSQGHKKLVFYGGCSMWFNLDMQQVIDTYGNNYRPIDVALNGTVNSEVQMQILSHYLEEGDVFFHTPELSSKLQLFEITAMGKNDNKLWAGLEYNYDLFSLVDVRGLSGWATSYSWFLSHKKHTTAYGDTYHDAKNRTYMGTYGEVPFERYSPETVELADEVTLQENVCSERAAKRLVYWYDRISDAGVQVYVSYACLNTSAITKEEALLLTTIDENFHAIVGNAKEAVLISSLLDYCYKQEDFYDTNYHLLTPQVYSITQKWLEDLKKYLS